MLLVALCCWGALLLASPCAAANATAAPSRMINATQCRWNAQLRTCDLSSGYLVAAFGTAKPFINSYAQGLVRSAAVELTCNQLANLTACGADARCVFDATQV